MDACPPMADSLAHGDDGRKLTKLQWAAMSLGVIALALLLYSHFEHLHHAVAADAGHGGDHGGGHAASHVPTIWSIVPFASLLLCIALLPLIPATAHWWEENQNRLMVALSFAGITLVYYFVSYDANKVIHVLDHAILGEYVPFITLLFSLYVISGGICLRGDLAAHPSTNTAFLAVGAAIASFVGTTGASMLLIRPLLQTNRERRHVVHTVVFFIFLVSNIGGCLLPIGDPPLFLGFLKGVPFLWTLGLWPEWLTACIVLLVVYFIWDSIAYRRETKRDIIKDETQREKLTLQGKLNFVWLIGIVLCVALIDPSKPLPLIGVKPFPFLREMIMLALTFVALKTTSPRLREANKFNYHAILEVAALFVGIFICMQAPIEILRASGASLEPLLSSPMRFFWATGVLSSFLDNAPTYVVFLETAMSMTPSDAAASSLVPLDGGTHAVNAAMLVAISLGSVFMGAMSYIGNGPNFMVKSIAEQSGVRMPSFFGYMLYSGLILVPIFIIITLIFI